MKTKENEKLQLDVLKDKLHKMLENTNGIVTQEIVEVSQALDDIIILEIRKHNYNKKNNTSPKGKVLFYRTP